VPFIPVPNVSVFSPIYIYDGQRCQNNFYVEHVSGWFDATQRTVADEMCNWWITKLATWVPQSCQLVQIDYRDLSTYDGNAGTFTNGLPVVGSHNSQQVPNNCSVAVSMKTARRGRSYRGRIYHIGLAEDEVEKNDLVGNFHYNLQTAYEDLLTTVNAVPDCTMVVVSRYSNKVARSVGVATAITGAVVNTKIDSQRRRLPGRGS
jgi:hypothetical protein